MFERSLWTFDLIACISFGVYVGRVLEVEAESGESHPDRVYLAMVIGGFSYLLAYGCSFFLRNRPLNPPSWVWLSIVGSTLFAFNSGVADFFITNVEYNRSRSVVEYFWSLFPAMLSKFLIGSLLFSLLTITLLIGMRFISFLILVLFKRTGQATFS